RKAVYDALDRGGVSTAGQRGIHVLFRLAHDGVLCFGARKGKEQTFVLLEDWLPKARKKKRDEGLHDLALRYFEGHGPATAKDFAWWSGLAAADAKEALASITKEVTSEKVGADTFFFVPSKTSTKTLPRVHLLPPFDEYVVAYKDRSALLEHAKELGAKTLNAGGGMLAAVVVVDGLIVGTWKRTLGKKSVTIEPKILAKKVKITKAELDEAANAYGAFLGLEARIEGKI
ncbi:MAG TPA: winged helix DNA-binding domain-containing protein, partial [Polyangiaceae bacterium]